MDKVIDDWYTLDKSNEEEKVSFLVELKRITDKMNAMDEKLNQIHQLVSNVETEKETRLIDKMNVMDEKLNQIHQRVFHLEKEHEPRTIELKKISLSLDELRIIKEREINALLREHIPFPFLLKHEPKIKVSPFSFKL
jgi:hypothetical protein